MDCLNSILILKQEFESRRSLIIQCNIRYDQHELRISRLERILEDRDSQQPTKKQRYLPNNVDPTADNDNNDDDINNNNNNNCFKDYPEFILDNHNHRITHVEENIFMNINTDSYQMNNRPYIPTAPEPSNLHCMSPSFNFEEFDHLLPALNLIVGEEFDEKGEGEETNEWYFSSSPLHDISLKNKQIHDLLTLKLGLESNYINESDFHLIQNHLNSVLTILQNPSTNI